jgi:acetyl-CoA acyltransferase 2
LRGRRRVPLYGTLGKRQILVLDDPRRGPNEEHSVPMAKLSKNIVIVGAKRTAFGTMQGILKGVGANDLAVHAAKAAMAQSGVPADAFGHVIVGNVMQTSADAIYCARHVGLKAGLPITTPALTVNRLCGSGFQAIVNAAEQILLGEADVVLACGTENMTQAPHVLRGARDGYAFGKAPALEDSLWSGLTDSYCNTPMAVTAENLAQKYGITRKDADEYALLSQQRWAAANERGLFKDEIVPLDVAQKKATVSFATDEHPRPQTTLEALAKLSPVFKKDGVVTAGNASGICDGAAALVLTTAENAASRGYKALARIVNWGVAGVEPTLMGIGPAPAIRQALDRAGLKLGDVDLVEVNEAFAPQYLAVEKELGLDRNKTNVNGGAIALGHPLGASGARITAHLVYELARRGGRYAVGSACIGGGQGIAVVIEKA